MLLRHPRTLMSNSNKQPARSPTCELRGHLNTGTEQSERACPEAPNARHGLMPCWRNASASSGNAWLACGADKWPAADGPGQNIRHNLGRPVRQMPQTSCQGCLSAQIARTQTRTETVSER